MYMINKVLSDILYREQAWENIIQFAFGKFNI